MLLHLGGDVCILKKEVIGIFDVSKTKNAVTREFLEIARDEKRIYLETKNKKIKSFVLAGDNIYFSPISSTTLQKRFSDIKQVINMKTPE